MIVRAAIATLVVSLIALATSALSPTSVATDALIAADPDATVRAFEDSDHPAITLDVGIYAGREELLDPREVLPTWHRHARAEAALVFEATRSCPPRPLSAPLSDASLAKAYAFAERTCDGSAAPESLVATPPFMHPSGRSYAAMEMARSGNDAHAFASRHWKDFHVLELAQSHAEGDEARALAALGSREWLGLSRGDRIVQTRDRIVIAERGPLGLSQLRFHDRASWHGPLSLASRGALACAKPASSLLCWEAVAPRRSARLHAVVRAIAASTSLASIIVLAIAFARERRRAALDRLHLLRTLTHEIRTPAAALVLAVEPLRASYDELPAHLQTPLLRISSDIARLQRVIHHSARALELYEGQGSIATLVEVDSLHELFSDLAPEWGDFVTLVFEGDDDKITTDPEWLAIALRNLVENARVHGKPPIVVRVRLQRELIVRVEDGGSTPALSLRRATTAFSRAETSGGIGLGLALVARVTKALGGTLAHEATPTAFVLRLPKVSR